MFWLHTSSLWKKLCILSGMQKLFFTITLCSLTSLSFFLYQYIILNPAITNYKQALEKNDHYAQTMQKLNTSLHSLNKQYVALELEELNCSKTCPPTTQEYLDQWLNTLKQHQIICKKIQPITTVSKDGFYQHSISMNIKGSFHHLKRCINEFYAQSPYACEILLEVDRHKRKALQGLLSLIFFTWGAS